MATSERVASLKMKIVSNSQLGGLTKSKVKKKKWFHDPHEWTPKKAIPSHTLYAVQAREKKKK